MKRFYIAIGLIIIIFLSFSFIILRLLASGSQDNFFNQKYRLKFARSQLIRNVLALHDVGDGRSDYLDANSSAISIEVDSMDGLSVPQQSLDMLAENIKKATGKNVFYIRSGSKTSNPELYLYYLNKSNEEPNLLGLTYHENGAMLFDEALKHFTQANPETFNYYVESTALHEFGHQLGLTHNSQPGCLMNEHAEQNHQAVQKVSDIVTDFCDFEREEIK